MLLYFVITAGIRYESSRWLHLLVDSFELEFGETGLAIVRSGRWRADLIVWLRSQLYLRPLDL